MKITNLGAGLNILIPCDYSASHNWMAFLCWYSISKNFPDANIVIVCNRQLMTHEYFKWAQKCKVPFILHKQTDIDGQINIAMKSLKLPLLVVPPNLICIRDFEEVGIEFIFEEKVYKTEEINGMQSDCKNNFSTVFVSYLEGWGQFVTASWIHNNRCPLLSNYAFSQGIMNVNETRIGKLWKAGTLLFNTLARV